MAGLLDRDHYIDNLVDRVEALTRRVAELERLFPGRAGTAADKLAYYRPEDGSLRAPQFARILYQNRARATQSKGQSIPNNAYTVVEYDTEEYDARGEWDAVTNFRFTAEVEGYFLVAALVTFDDTDTFTGAESAQLRVYRNGATLALLDFRDQLDVAVGTTGYVCLHGTTLVYLDTGSYLDIRVMQNSGGALTLYPNTNWNWVAVHCLS